MQNSERKEKSNVRYELREGHELNIFAKIENSYSHITIKIQYIFE